MDKPKELWVLKDAIGAERTDVLEHEPTRHTISDFIHVLEYEANEQLKDLLGECEEVISDAICIMEEHGITHYDAKRILRKIRALEDKE